MKEKKGCVHMTDNTLRRLAKKTFLALKNPYQSVVDVYPQVIDTVSYTPFNYIGVKNRPEIPRALIKQFEKTGQYGLHTRDAYSLGGRAIDTRLSNPITGKPMTGSSSGTAINVLVGINDLGIGTDGGGSVLAPAMSLNLFSFISPSICQEHTRLFTKYSTDAHSFTPSIGFITRDYEGLKQAINVIVPLSSSKTNNSKLKLLAVNEPSEINPELRNHDFIHTEVDLNASRKKLISFLKNNLECYDIILSKEGPIDFHGLGDTVLGHMGNEVKAYQDKGNKGLIRVANMAGAAAMTIPNRNHATSYVLLCKDTPEHISNMLEVASTFAIEHDKLLERYFMNFDHYFADGFDYYE